MTYSLRLISGKIEDFTVYDYHYQNPNLKKQFDSEYPNIAILYKKSNDGFELVNSLIVDNPKGYFRSGLPDDDLTMTDKVLLLSGCRPASLEETVEFLKKKLIQIKSLLPEWTSLTSFQKYKTSGSI